MTKIELKGVSYLYGGKTPFEKKALNNMDKVRPYSYVEVEECE